MEVGVSKGTFLSLYKSEDKTCSEDVEAFVFRNRSTSIL